MNDTYGKEPQEHENEHDDAHEAYEHDVHEAPSDYEFSDPAAAEEHPEDDLAAPSDEAPARRSPILPIVAAVGGVLLLGTVAWWQFGSALMGTSVVATNVAPMTTSLSVPPLPVAPKVASSDGMPQGAETPALPVMPSAGYNALPTPAIPAPVVTRPVNNTVAQTQSNEVVDQRINALTARIEDIQKQLEQANKQLAQMTDKIAVPVVSGEAEAKNKELQDRLDKIEQKMAEQRAMPVATVPPPVAVSSIAATTPAPDALSPSAVKHKAVRKVSHKAKSADKKKASKRSVASEQPTSAWVLRAASPEQAWVSTSATSRELKSVQVGDTFDGIGKITAIQQKDGGWVVQGTAGTIQ